MKIGSLTNAANTALSSTQDVFRQIDDVANRVAAGIQTEFEESTAEFAGALAELPTLKMQARANARVVETAEALLNELGSLSRK